MSTTRLRSRPAPATEGASEPWLNSAVILVAHGDRGAERANEALHAHAAGLVQATPGLMVEVGILNGSPRLEDAVEKVRHCGQVHVFPLLMSEGYFTDTVIPDRLARGLCGERFVLHRPLGRSPKLTDLAVEEGLKGCRVLRVRPGEVTVLLAGHGAKSNTRARLAIEAHADEMRRRSVFATVETAYLEEPPFLPDVLDCLAGPAVMIGMFASEGLHAGEDLPAAMEHAQGVQAYYTGAIGAHPKVGEIVAGAIERFGADAI